MPKASRLIQVVPSPVWYVYALLAAALYASSQWGSSLLWPYAVLYWIVVGGFLYCYTQLQPTDLFSPVLGLILLLFLYSFASGLYVEEYGVMYFGEAASRWVRAMYYFSCLAGLLGLGLGALLGSHVKQTPFEISQTHLLARLVPTDPVVIRRLLIWSALLAACLWPWIHTQFDFLSVASYSERSLNLRLERMASTVSGPREVFLTQIPTTYILCATTLLILGSRRLWAKLVGASVFSAYVITNTLAGWRGAVVAALLFPLVYYHYRVKRVTFRVALIGGTLIYLFVNGLSVVRFTSNPLEMFGALRDNVGANGLAFAKLTSSGELVVAHNLMRLISGIESGETGFTYGRSLVTELAVFVPKYMFPNRPPALSEKFVEVFYPGVFESGGGYGFFILQDGYWALGIPGVFLSMLFYGWGIQKVYLFFMRRLTNDVALLCYSAVYAALVMAAVRTGMIGSFKAAIVNALPFGFLWVLLKVGFDGFSLKNPAADPTVIES